MKKLYNLTKIITIKITKMNWLLLKLKKIFIRKKTIMKKALLVGINDYPVNPLYCCVNDVISLGTVIETHGNGAPNFEVKIEKNTATQSSLRKQINELFAGDCDIALFYFSGHGHINSTGGYIVTPDSTKYNEGVGLDYVMSVANNSKIKNRVIILDCCFSGAIGDLKFSNACSQDGISVIKEGTTILTACRNIETAAEVNGHGIFTNLLIEALRGGAADINGNITPGNIYSYIDKALGAWEQRPVFKTNTTSFVSLREVPAQIPIEVIRKIKEYFPTPQDSFKLDPSFEFTNDPKIEHKVVEPYAVEKNVKIFQDLQKLQSVGLVVPFGSKYMYFAAMESNACKLTALGAHYWYLVNRKLI